MSSPNLKAEERIAKFKRNVEALNKQFLEWVTSQIGAQPDRLLTNGITDYTRHAAKLRLEYQDVINSNVEDDKDNVSGSPNGHPRTTYTPPLLSLMPLCHTKILHFIRHGEGWHNVGLANADAHLTPKGWQQAHALGRHMLDYEITRTVQLVVISPLMRTLETAAGVFGEEEVPCAGATIDGTVGSSSSISEGVLMVAQSEVPQVRYGHGVVRKRPRLLYLANEDCRERLGPSSCDSRRSRAEASAAFPGVDFSLLKSDVDGRWRAGAVEPEAEVVFRGREFLQWLMSLPQTNIAVVTHSAFLWFTLSLFGVENARPVRERLQRWYENCEMRSVVLGDGGSAQVVAAYNSDYRGGTAVAEPSKELMAGGEVR